MTWDGWMCVRDVWRCGMADGVLMIAVYRAECKDVHIMHCDRWRMATVHDPVECGIVHVTTCIVMNVHPLCDGWVIHSYNPTAICSEFWKDAILKHPTCFRQASAWHLRPFSSILKRVFEKMDLDCSFKWHCLIWADRPYSYLESD